MSQNGPQGHAHLTRRQCTVLGDVLRYNLDERSDVLADETVDWLEVRLEAARTDDTIPVEPGDADRYRRFSREFARAIQRTVDDQQDLEMAADFFEEVLMEVIQKVQRAGGTGSAY